MKNNKGFTLLELVITMALVIIVIMITGSAFDSIIKNSTKLVSSEESNVEGVVGLEMLRHDLQQIGYGIPHAFDAAINYSEAASAPANLLNDSGAPPRAVASLNQINNTAYTTGNAYNILAGTDYLSIKASSVGRSKASQKWTFQTYTSIAAGTFGRAPNQWSNPADNFASTNSAIVLSRTFSSSGILTSTLIHDTTNPTTYWLTDPTTAKKDSPFNPVSSMQIFYMYGIDDGNLRMPFNRADYFVARPSTATDVPTTCALNTGILYKATVSHTDGSLTYYPLLDCVASMQVVFGWDVNGNGVIDETSAYDPAGAISTSISSGTDPAKFKTMMESPDNVRNMLKYVKVYIMAQEGRKDTSFVNTNPIVVGDNINLTQQVTVANLAAQGWLNYRWKVYRIMVKPKNLASN